MGDVTETEDAGGGAVPSVLEVPSLEQDIHRLLADPQYDGHPLQLALRALWGRYAGLAVRLDRITRISDVYQSVMIARETDLSAQLDQHLRRLSKLARISDRYQGMMQDLNAALMQASTHDLLTGLPNRRLMIERLKSETARARRTGVALTVVMLDLDDFKAINDAYGHDAGDATLVTVAQTLANHLRQSDICGRWGGEEFLLLLPDTDCKAAIEVMERMRRLVPQACQTATRPNGLMVTFSAGLSMFRAEDSDYAAMVSRADHALMRAKRNGRNCVDSEY